jgi:hypothetical protein
MRSSSSGKRYVVTDEIEAYERDDLAFLPSVASDA